MNRYEQKREAVKAAIREHITKYKAIYQKASDEKRDPTDEERAEIQSHLDAIEGPLAAELKEAEDNIKTMERVDALGREMGPALGGNGNGHVQVGEEPHDRFHQAFAKTIGEQFTDSEAFKKGVQMYRETGRLQENWSSGPVMVEMKGTLQEGPGGGGGALASTVPQVVPGVVDKLFQKLTFADLILSGQATTSSLRYVVEGTATSGAAGVAEAGNKPESTLGLTTTDEPIKKIATLLPVSEEMIQDAPAIQSYINGRLSLFVRIEEERQLLRGASGGNEVQGILTSRGVPVYAGGTAVGNRAVQLFKAMNGMRGSAFVEPEWVVMHPTDWEATRLLTDTAGQFFGGGPFLGPYGGPQGPIGQSAQVQGPQDTIWNVPVYVTAAIGGAGTALVGSRSNAQVWRRGGMSVEATNSHSTFFALNLIAIRAEERLGLAVYRPTGFVEVRLS